MERVAVSLELHDIFNVLMMIAVGGTGWFAKSIWDAVQDLKTDIHEIEVDLPRSYVSKDDFSKTMRHIEDMFQRIYDKLDHKVDK
jgi:hypothetical protein